VLVLLTLSAVSISTPSTGDDGDLDELIWSISDSPVTLDSSIEINQTTRLTIEAGVEVRLGLNVTILVRGELHVLGTEVAPVRFVPNTSMQVESRFWGDLLLHSDSADREHIVRWAEFHNADNGLLASSANVSVEDCVFDTCRNGILARSDAVIEVVRSQFNNSSAAGIEWQTGAEGFASSCTFSDNHLGIYCYDGGVPLVTDCTFTGNDHHMSFALGSNATVVRCALDNSSAEPIECYWRSSPQLTDVTLEEPEGLRVFLRDGCRPRFLRGVNVTLMTVDATDDASFATVLRAITVIVKDDKGKRLEEANVTIRGTSGDLLFKGRTLGDGRIADALMVNMTFSDTGDIYRENPQCVLVEFKGFNQTFYFDESDLTRNGVLVLELDISRTEPAGPGIWIWLLLLLVVVISAGVAVIVRRR
jgi:hypothetical protein